MTKKNLAFHSPVLKNILTDRNSLIEEQQENLRKEVTGTKWL